MSTPHRATAEEWDEISAAASNPSGEACSAILELRARVEALEATQQPADSPAGNIFGVPAGSLLERVSHAIDQAAGNIFGVPAVLRHDDDENPVAIPAGSLLERVSHAIDQAAGDSPNTYEPEARAAIREVAAWLRIGRLLHAAELLEQEANRG